MRNILHRSKNSQLLSKILECFQLAFSVRQKCNISHPSLTEGPNIRRGFQFEQHGLNLFRQRQQTHNLTYPSARNSFCFSELRLSQRGIRIKHLLPFQRLLDRMHYLFCDARGPQCWFKQSLVIYVGIHERNGDECTHAYT